MKIHVYKIFNLSSSQYLPEVYFTIPDVAKGFYDALKHNANIEIHKLHLTEIMDLTVDNDQEELMYMDLTSSDYAEDVRKSWDDFFITIASNDSPDTITIFTTREA